MRVHPRNGKEGPEGDWRYNPTLSSTLVLDEDGRSSPRPGHFIPGNDVVPILQEAEWAPGPDWTSSEKLAPTGIQSPDHPACSESLH